MPACDFATPLEYALAKLGADRITWTGHVPDTVLFSILRDEWPRDE